MQHKTREEYNNRKTRYFTKENCPFCSNLEKTNQVLFKTKFWKIVYNKYPYFWNKKWLIAFPIRHEDFTWKLSSDEFWDFIEVQKFMKDFFKWEDYFSFIRETKWNRTVEHLHYHFLPWKLSAKIINENNYLKVSS